MEQNFLKITYHLGNKKMNAYLKMPSPTYSVLKKEIELCLFEERKQPRCEIRTYWIGYTLYTSTTSSTSGPETTTTTKTSTTTSCTGMETMEDPIAAATAAAAAQFASQHAHDAAVKAAEIAAKVAHEVAINAASRMTDSCEINTEHNVLISHEFFW